MKKNPAQTQSNLTQDQIQAKAQGWNEGFDEAIDQIVVRLRKQTEALHKAARETNRVDVRDNCKFGVDMYKVLVEELKKLKHNKSHQRFSEEEVRAVVDHVTGSTQSLNNATMSFFDTSFFPRYLAGEIELKTFTLKLTPESK